MADPDLAPMSVTQILDRTFSLYRQHWPRFLAIVAVVQVPISLIGLVAGIVMGVSIGDTGAQMGRQIEGAVIAALVIVAFVGFIVAILGHSLCNAALIRSVSESYLGGDVTVGQAYRTVLPRLVSIIVAAFLVGAVTMVGLLLCVVPGVFLMLWLCLTITAIIVEDVGPLQGMSRSKQLVSGNLGKVFVLGLLVMLISWAVGIAAQFLGAPASPALIGAVPSIVIRQLLSLAATVVTAPISATATVLLYYDLRIRKEAFDLEMLAKSMGRAGPEAASGSAL